MREAIAGEAFKVTPPAAVWLYAWLAGLTIGDVVGLVTLLYLGLQALYLIWKWRREASQK